MVNKIVKRIGIFVMMLLMVFLVYRDLKLENKITSLQTEISLLKEDHNLGTKYDYYDDTFNYLAIGNSITVHEICDYWYTRSGLAASQPDLDYYHQIAHYLNVYKGDVTSYPVNFSTWENLNYDRAETLYLLDSYLDERLDLITIQLGENVSDLSNFQSDFSYLITYLKQKAPAAQIIIIGDFWKFLNRDTLKNEVAESYDCEFVSLKEIQDKKEYMCGKGAIILDPDGVEHKVTHSGVAKHPNDDAMAYIASKVTEKIR